MRLLRQLLASACVAAAVAAAPAVAEQRQVTLAPSGEILRVRAGNHGEIYGFGGFNNPVLVLEVVGPEKSSSTERLLVPGTEGEEVETSPSIVYEDSTGTAFLIWESRHNSIHSQIRLVSYREGQWSEPIDLPGEFFSLKTRPRLAITRDVYVTLDEQGEPVTRKRAIYHVVWWEEAGAGERVVYSPLVLLDGAYVGWSPFFVFNELALGLPAAGGVEASAELARSPTIQAGVDGATVVVGLVDAPTGRLVALELRVIPGELGAVTAAVEREVRGGEDGPGKLADRVRHQLIEFGNRMRLHPGLVDYLAGVASQEITAGEAGASLPSLADRVRHQLIEFGTRMFVQGLGETPPEKATWLFEIPADADAASTDPVHSLYVRLASSRPIPETKPGVPTTLYLSRDGEEALVVSEVGERLDYRESKGDGWGPVRRLHLSDDLDREEAHALLSERAQDR